jgi:hypothetical protein
MIPTGTLGLQILARAWVPVDDEHMFLWSINAPRSRRLGQGGGGGFGGFLPNGGRTEASAANAARPRLLPDSSDWLGKFRLNANMRNDYFINREAQATEKTGIGYTGLGPQDEMITESMGPIMDRSKEHLGSSDQMIIRTRRRLLAAMRELETDGTVPMSVDHPEVYRQRSGGVILPREANWLEATAELRKAFVDHPEITENSPQVATQPPTQVAAQ